MDAQLNRRDLLGCAAVFVPFVSSCGGGSSNGTPDSPSSELKSAVVGGDQQVARVGTELTQALVINVRTRDGEPVQGRVVNFVVTQGGGQVFAEAVNTDTGGFARNRWSLGVVSGGQQLEVRTIDSRGEKVVLGVFNALAVPDVPVSLAILSGNGQAGFQARQLPDPIVLQAKDQFGNVTPSVALNFRPSSGGVSIPNGTSTDDAGVATVRWTLGIPAGAQTLTASIVGYPVVTTVRANAQRVSPGRPVAISAVNGSPAAANQHAEMVLQARVTDSLGNGVPDVPVTFSGATSGVYVRAQTLATDSNGLAICSCYVHLPGDVVIVAAAQGLAEPAPFHRTVQPYGDFFDGLYVVTGSANGISSPVTDIQASGSVIYNLSQCPGSYDFPCPPNPGTLALADGTMAMKMEWYGMLSSSTWVYSGALSVDGEGRGAGSGTMTGTSCDANIEGCWTDAGTWTAVRL